MKSDTRAAAARAASARGGQQSVRLAKGWRASDHFDWNKALRLTRRTLREVYGKDRTC